MRIKLLFLATLFPILTFGQLTGAWLLNNNANDATGAYNLTNNNVTFGAGMESLSGIFNSSNSGLSGTISSGLSGDWTIMAWINPTESSSSNVYTIAASSVPSYGNYWMSMQIWQSKITIGMYNGGAGNPLSQSSTVTNGVWYHCTGVRTGGYIYLYVNGVLVDSDSDLSLSVPSYSAWGIGIQVNGSPRRFVGQIDKVMLFSEALSAGKIKNCYILDKGFFQ